MPKALPNLDLDALAAPVGTITRFGKTHEVLPLNAVGEHLLHQLAAQKDAAPSTTDQVALARRIVADIIPSMSSEEREKLSVSDMTRIIALAGQPIEQVEQWIASQAWSLRSETASGKDEAPQESGPPAASSE